MEEENDAARARLDEFCATIEDQPDGEVFHACTLDLEHDPEMCVYDEASQERIWTHPDGTQLKCIDLDKWDVAISHENTCWAFAGMERGNVVHNIYEMDVTIQALVQVLIEHCGVTQDQMNAVYKPMLYANLHNFRERVEPGLRLQQLKAGGPGIIGPNGSRLN